MRKAAVASNSRPKRGGGGFRVGWGGELYPENEI